MSEAPSFHLSLSVEYNIIVNNFIYVYQLNTLVLFQNLQMKQFHHWILVCLSKVLKGTETVYHHPSLCFKYFPACITFVVECMNNYLNSTSLGRARPTTALCAWWSGSAQTKEVLGHLVNCDAIIIGICLKLWLMDLQSKVFLFESNTVEKY